MSHLTGGPVADFGYNLHHFARTFHVLPWEIERAVASGEVETGDVLRAMAIESADGRGAKKRRERDEQKARMARRTRRGT